MTDVTIPDIVLRTTSDGEAFAHGLAIGTGGDVDQAVNALADEARRQAEEITRERGDDPARYFEVADVRLAADAGGESGERWAAYGTLRSTHLRPGGGGYWAPGSLD